MTKTIKHYYVHISDKAGIIKNADKFEVSELNVIAENNINIVVDDLHFTTIKKEKSDYSICLGKPRIGLSHGDSVWGSRITYSLYTEKTKRTATIKAEIEKAVMSKFGFFINSLDLSVLSEKDLIKGAGIDRQDSLEHRP